VVRLAVAKRVPVLCQRPMAEAPEGCEAPVTEAAAAGVWFAVHEYWRFQAPLRRMRELLADGVIGTPFRARMDSVGRFDMLAKRSLIKVDKQFIFCINFPPV
jgi:predicted dehydrogenase